MVTQNGKIFRDFISWSTQSGTTDDIHIKTNIRKGSGTMFRFLIEGYNYQAGTPINSEAVGYTFNQDNCLVYTSTIDHAPNVTTSLYCSSDDYVVIRLDVRPTLYFVGLSVSVWFVNPNNPLDPSTPPGYEIRHLGGSF